MDIRITKANIEHANVFGEIAARSWQAAYKGIIPDDYLSGVTSESRAERFKMALSQMPEVEFFLVSVDNIPAGVMNIHPCADEDAKGCGEIGAFYFLPEYWGKGCAAQAMEFALNRLRERAFPEAALWVLEENARARRFYEKHGFFPDGMKKTINLGKEMNEIRYKRSL
jgi:GNAT superfamily N-acetyltransferase